MELRVERRTALYAALSRLQAALELADLWEEERPADDALASELPFSYDTLCLHQWLQWRFIPRIRGILDRNEVLPTACAIYPYAEDQLDEAELVQAEVLMVIRELDELISARGEQAH